MLISLKNPCQNVYNFDGIRFFLFCNKKFQLEIPTYKYLFFVFFLPGITLISAFKNLNFANSNANPK